MKRRNHIRQLHRKQRESRKARCAPIEYPVPPTAQSLLTPDPAHPAPLHYRPHHD